MAPFGPTHPSTHGEWRLYSDKSLRRRTVTHYSSAHLGSRSVLGPFPVRKGGPSTHPRGPGGPPVRPRRHDVGARHLGESRVRTKDPRWVGDRRILERVGWGGDQKGRFWEIFPRTPVWNGCVDWRSDSGTLEIMQWRRTYRWQVQIYNKLGSIEALQFWNSLLLLLGMSSRSWRVTDTEESVASCF